LVDLAKVHQKTLIYCVHPWFLLSAVTTVTVQWLLCTYFQPDSFDLI